jgi:predicted MFS family arabinose efflux permease
MLPELRSLHGKSDMVAATMGERSDAKVVGLVASAHFFAHLYALVVPPLFPTLRDAFGVSYAELGFIVTAFNLATVAAQTPMGFLVDRLGARLILTVGLLLMCVAVAAIGAAADYWSVVVLYSLAGLANSVFHPADYALLNANVDKSRIGRAFSIHTFSGYLGFAAAPIVVIGLAELVGWRLALILTGAMGLTVVAALVIQRDSMLEARTSKAGGADGPAAGLGLLLSWPIVLSFVFFVLIAGASNAINSFSVTALNLAYGTPIWAVTTGLTAFLGLGAVGILAGGLVADRTDRHGTVAATCLVVTAALFALMAVVDLGIVGLIAVMSVAGFLNGVIQPSRDMMVRAVTPAGATGKVFGFVTSGFNVGGAVAPLGFGLLLDYGGAQNLFWVVTLITLLTVVTVASLRTRRAA